ncbi:type VI secretion system protein TssA [Sulfidibacter corallicola]|uniref:Type VI secretion system protein TssA n=1 Tax=Sulfidibacter corallicola TaxID=2818388 RepID=A0A8A4TPX4_SULCO|nr:type VI secretion system protein TssA [Sulfidibacter corallicola]QTD50961.1 type VI secretion system protein TssA [Sulfidibacter corallicola]
MTAATAYTALLEPIAPEAPCGQDLRYEPIHDRIEEARREEDESLPRGDWERELKQADWSLVAELCEEALRTRTKDLRLAIWLVEARVRSEGWAEAGPGFAFLQQLAETFWDGLYPGAGDDDQEARAHLFEWMITSFGRLLHRVPVTQSTQADDRTFSLHQWQNALAGNQRLSSDPNEGPSAERIEKALHATDATYLDRLHRDLATARAAAETLDRTLESLLGTEAPGFHALYKPLDFALRHLEPWSTTEPSEGETGTASPDEADSQAEGAAASGVEAGRIVDRDQAYRQIGRIADYLMEVEPHSPTPYLLRRIAGWGSKSLFELLEETVPSDQERDHFKGLLYLHYPNGAS